MTAAPISPPALAGIRVTDLSRVLAGPWCTQILGDLGADVVKVEQPAKGDDTRRWGPPYLRDAAGNATTESAYYLSANRNKRSLTVDFTRPEGRAVVKRLIARSDVLVENYKVGALARHGLAWEQLRAEFPRLVYCSITGFGQDGPYAHRGGYDYLAQGMSGLMSVTGPVDGDPTKVGTGVSDLTTGLYATIGILAALRHRDATGEGQAIDVSLLESQIAALGPQAQFFLTSGTPPPRLGNGHPNIVPYDTFPTSDGHLILAVGNDRQFGELCALAGLGSMPEDERFRTNEARILHRRELTEILRRALATRTTAEWLHALEQRGVPAGPVHRIDQVFADPHVRARGTAVPMAHPLASEPIAVVASPIRLAATPPSYRRPPPPLGQDTDEVLRDVLGYGAEEIARLRESGVL